MRRRARPPVLDAAHPESLVAALRHDNQFWRLHAQRLLVERGKTDVVPALIDLVRDGSVDAIGLNPARSMRSGHSRAWAPWRPLSLPRLAPPRPRSSIPRPGFAAMQCR